MIDVGEGAFLARLRSFVRRRVRSSDEADEIVQNVVLRLLAGAGERAPSAPHAWIAQVARTAIVDAWRARGRPDAAASTDAGIEALAIAREGLDELGDASECLVPLLRSLDPDDRALLERVDVAGEPQAKLARELGLSPSGMKSRVQRARARLRELVLARCQVERDARGEPTGPATCATGDGGPSRTPCCEPVRDEDDGRCA